MLHINSWDDLPAGIATAEQAGTVGVAHLMLALRAGWIAFLPLLPETSAGKFNWWAGMTRRRPAVVMPNFRTAMIKSLGKQGDRGLAAV
jgi:hypothetical protein